MCSTAGVRGLTNATLRMWTTLRWCEEVHEIRWAYGNEARRRNYQVRPPDYEGASESASAVRQRGGIGLAPQIEGKRAQEKTTALTCANGVRHQNLNHRVRSAKRAPQTPLLSSLREGHGKGWVPVISGAALAKDVDECQAQYDIPGHLDRRSDGCKPLEGPYLARGLKCTRMAESPRNISAQHSNSPL